MRAAATLASVTVLLIPPALPAQVVLPAAPPLALPVPVGGFNLVGQAAKPAAPVAAPAAAVVGQAMALFAPEVAEPPKPDPLAGPVKKLVADLASADFRVREKAGKELAALGERGLPEMRKALATVDDAEASRRLGVLVRRLNNDRLTQPKRLTLTAENKTPKELIDAIAKQTGYTLQFNGGGSADSARLSVNWKGVPFWAALDEVCAAAGLTCNPDYSSGNNDREFTLQIYNQDTLNPYVGYGGPFRFLATNVSTNRQLQLSGLPRKGPANREPEYLTLNFSAHSEPKNPMIGSTPPVVTRAVDDTGGNLIPPPAGEGDDWRFRRSYYYPYYYRGHSQQVYVNLVRPGRGATHIQEVRGKVGLILLAEVRPEITVDNLPDVKKKKFVGRTTEVEIDTVTPQGNGVSVAMTLRQVNGNPNDYSWTNTIYQKVEVQDANGVKFVQSGSQSRSSSGSQVSMTVTYVPPTGGNGKAGKAAKLVVNEWETLTLDTEFVFKDIPLP